MNISIVTPTWNRAGHLRNAIESVARQNALPFEHIIVDNMSTDATKKIVEEYASIAQYNVIYIREKDNGIYEAMNKGIKYSSGEAVYFLNDDDRFFSQNVLSYLEVCIQKRKADIIFGDVFLIDKEEKISRRRHRQVNKLTLMEKTITQQAILYHKSAFKRCGFFNEDLHIVGDYEWLLRAFITYNIRAVYLKTPVAYFSTEGISNDPKGYELHQRERRLVLDRFFQTKDIKSARIYRRWLRKIPFGATLLNLFVPLRLNVINMQIFRGHPFPDPLALLDL